MLSIDHMDDDYIDDGDEDDEFLIGSCCKYMPSVTLSILMDGDC